MFCVGSNEGSQHTFSLRNKKKIFLHLPLLSGALRLDEANIKLRIASLEVYRSSLKFYFIIQTCFNVFSSYLDKVKYPVQNCSWEYTSVIFVYVEIS